MYIPRWYREASIFLPFLSKRNEMKMQPESHSHFYSSCAYVRVLAYVCMRVCSTHVLMVSAFIFIFPFVSNVSRYIRMSSVAQLGFSFTFWSRHRPDFPPFFPLPLLLFPRFLFALIFFFFSSKKNRCPLNGTPAFRARDRVREISVSRKEK